VAESSIQIPVARQFATTNAALKFVEFIICCGSGLLSSSPRFMPGSGKKLFADWLLVELPSVKLKRNSLRKICQTFCRKRGGAVLPEFDLGESHLFLMLQGLTLARIGVRLYGPTALCQGRAVGMPSGLHLDKRSRAGTGTAV